MDVKYEIHIGKSDVIGEEYEPKTKLLISEEQKQIIEEFADTFKDENLNTIHVINAVKFKIFPHFKQE